MIVTSSLIYLLAFIYPKYLYVGVYLWMLPLVVTDKDNDYGFKEGLVWGLIFFGGHLVWFASIVYGKGKGDTRMLIYLATAGYYSLFSGFWLWLKQLLVYRWVLKTKTLKGEYVASWCTWIISTAIFIYLTCYCSLAIVDCFEGYPFINPLLLLVSWNWYLRPICYFGSLYYWIVIIMINLILSKLVIKYDTNSLIFLVLLLFFPVLFQPPEVLSEFIDDEIAYLKPTWNDMDLTQAQKFYQISRQIDYLVLGSPDIKYIVIPESGFPHDLLAWESRLHVWTSLFTKDTSILIGAHRRCESKVYNCLYQIDSDGKIVAWYDKSHLMAFVERIPWVFRKISIFANLFTQDDAVFSYPAQDQEDISIVGCRPYICSELFFEAKRPVRDRPIVFICNDSWIGLPYARDLAKRSAQLYSLRYQVPILYVGSYDCEIITTI